MQRNVTSALAAASLALVLAACSGTPAPTAVPTPEPTPVVTPAPSPAPTPEPATAAPASPAASAAAETAALVAYPSLAPGMSLPPATTPSPVEPEPAISPAPSGAVDRQASSGPERLALCVRGWDEEMWGGGPEIEGQMYTGTPICRTDRRSLATEVAMRATYLETYAGDLQPVIWYIAADWGVFSDKVEVTIEKERKADGDMGLRGTRTVARGGSAVITVEDQTFKIRVRGIDRPGSGVFWDAQVDVEMCAYAVCRS